MNMILNFINEELLILLYKFYENKKFKKELIIILFYNILIMWDNTIYVNITNVHENEKEELKEFLDKILWFDCAYGDRDESWVKNLKTKSKKDPLDDRILDILVIEKLDDIYVETIKAKLEADYWDFKVNEEY